MQGIIVVGHGSKASHASEVLTSVGEALSRNYPRVAVASMQFNRPTIDEAVRDFISKGVRDIVIAPFFLYTGNHVTIDIPEELEALGREFPDVSFRLADSLGFDERLLGVLQERIDSALGCGSTSAHEGGVALADGGALEEVAPDQIEAKSMQIVEKLIAGVPYEGIDFEIVQRIVHTTGDPGVARHVIVGEGAAEAGVRALRGGAPVIVDVTMVKSGLHRRVLAKVGCEVVCLIEDEKVAAAARERGKTRAATAMRHLAERMEGAVVVVGNAPTALMEVNSLLNEGVRPALIVGTPVGFVGARESKEAIVAAAEAHGVPFITVKGYRGGSPVAAAVVNAILRHC